MKIQVLETIIPPLSLQSSRQKAPTHCPATTTLHCVAYMRKTSNGAGLDILAKKKLAENLAKKWPKIA